MSGISIRIRGIVQGVGFRPAVWRMAGECEIAGTVGNDAHGVLIQAWGSKSNLSRFKGLLETFPPPLARVESIEILPITGDAPHLDFQIIGSSTGEAQTGIAPDAATCPDCLKETLNPKDRRTRYPFTNCTHCGPRLSIIRSVPYDRGNTSMDDFKMCEVCQGEYDDPADRRFHAQPNACAVCGPRVWIEDGQGNEIESMQEGDAVSLAASLIEKGEIIAIKGIGGFHLACDAAQSKTVSQLRQRKKRYKKPFALMAHDVDSISNFARVGEAEEWLLRDRAAPIVILEAEGEPLAPGLAPGQSSLGFMLPYTPLHHLLMDHLKRPIVMTSANISDEPQCFENSSARERLSGIANYFLLHDRSIVNRLDDSVLRNMDGTPRFLRRARGYAPEPLLLPKGFEGAPDIMAMGGELKNTFCLLKDGRAMVSQHMGDLEEMSVLRDYLDNIDLYEQLFDHRPQAIAIDLHPGYLSSQTGRDWSRERGVALIEVQHHHAHVAACMAEHGLPADTQDVLGIVLDGLGMGDDGTIWGAEFMKAGYASYERLARFRPVPMIGAAQAVREPWRSAYAQLRQSLGWQMVADTYGGLDIVDDLQRRPLKTLETMADKGLNSPMASSAGRLFDAAAAILGISRDGVSYEGEAAILMEDMAAPCFTEEKARAYPSSVNGDNCFLLELVWDDLWTNLLDDLMRGTDQAVVAARFHQGVVVAVSDLAERLARQHGLSTVILGGGVFQNRLILEGVTETLSTTGLRVHSPRLFPANDGGLSLGQAAIAAIRQTHGKPRKATESPEFIIPTLN